MLTFNHFGNFDNFDVKIPANKEGNNFFLLHNFIQKLKVRMLLNTTTLKHWELNSFEQNNISIFCHIWYPDRNWLSVIISPEPKICHFFLDITQVVPMGFSRGSHWSLVFNDRDCLVPSLKTSSISGKKYFIIGMLIYFHIFTW